MRWEEKASILFSNISKNSVDIKETKIGIVISSEPLQIEIGELVLNKENLYINEDLLKYERIFTIPVQGASGNTSDGASIIDCSFSKCKIIFESRFKIGDLVALRKLEFEKYYLEAKVKRGSDI